jgi:dTDP-4-dehydrorhamnose 3,5-epimerase
MKVTQTALPGVLLIEPKLFRDARGHFLESWNRARYADVGLDADFVQDNVSRSGRGVLRGLHFQHPQPQGKLVSALTGEVWDVVVDVRAGSPTFGRWEAFTLSAENARQLWVPRGYAHGFVVRSESAVVGYKCDDFYAPECEQTLLWSDPALGIAWPVEAPLLSEKDRAGRPLAEIEPARLPPYEPVP